MIRFQTSIRIACPIKHVFSYVSDPCNLPTWNSAVRSVREATPDSDTREGSMYVMERDLPIGRATNGLEVVTTRRSDEFTIRTTSGPTPFAYRFIFSSQEGATVVQLDAQVNLGVASLLLSPVLRHAVRNGVDDNLATLKAHLEATRPAARQVAGTPNA
jgi:uncharacterized membrane protein